MRPILFLLFTLAQVCVAEAAGPVTHIYLAGKWAQFLGIPAKQQQIDFLAGNLFPDIRYMGEICRHETHEPNLSLEDVKKSPTPFRMGMRLHAYIDEKREELVELWGIYSHVEAFAEGHKATLLKLVEDEILYEKMSIPPIMQALAVIPEEELAFGLSPQSLQAWHEFLLQYLSLRPSQLLEQLAMQNRPLFDVPPQTVKLWSKELPKLAAEQVLREYVNCLVESFIHTFLHSP